MKSIRLVNCFLLVFILVGCPDKGVSYLCIKNNSHHDIVFYYYGGEHSYPDTTFILKPSGIINPSSVPCTPINRPLEYFAQMARKDTLSFFFFHADTLEKYSLRELQRDYNILRRYDLSSQDIIILKNERGFPEIPYPPDERMKYMKMWPPYGSE